MLFRIPSESGLRRKRADPADLRSESDREPPMPPRVGAGPARRVSDPGAALLSAATFGFGGCSVIVLLSRFAHGAMSVGHEWTKDLAAFPPRTRNHVARRSYGSP